MLTRNQQPVALLAGLALRAGSARCEALVLAEEKRAAIHAALAGPLRHARVPFERSPRVAVQAPVLGVTGLRAAAAVQGLPDVPLALQHHPTIERAGRARAAVARLTSNTQRLVAVLCPRARHAAAGAAALHGHQLVRMANDRLLAAQARLAVFGGALVLDGLAGGCGGQQRDERRAEHHHVPTRAQVRILSRVACRGQAAASMGERYCVQKERTTFSTAGARARRLAFFAAKTPRRRGETRES